MKFMVYRRSPTDVKMETEVQFDDIMSIEVFSVMILHLYLGESSPPFIYTPPRRRVLAP
jgi:hypothetical protein